MHNKKSCENVITRKPWWKPAAWEWVSVVLLRQDKAVLFLMDVPVARGWGHVENSIPAEAENKK